MRYFLELRIRRFMRFQTFGTEHEAVLRLHSGTTRQRKKHAKPIFVTH